MKQVIQFFVNVWNAQRNAEALFDAGMDSAAIDNIRIMLALNCVPTAAFVDDHVGNAIAQRDLARAEVANLSAELSSLRQQVSKRDSSGRFAPKNTGQ